MKSEPVSFRWDLEKPEHQQARLILLALEAEGEHKADVLARALGLLGQQRVVESVNIGALGAIIADALGGQLGGLAELQSAITELRMTVRKLDGAIKAGQMLVGSGDQAATIDDDYAAGMAAAVKRRGRK